MTRAGLWAMAVALAAGCGGDDEAVTEDAALPDAADGVDATADAAADAAVDAPTGPGIAPAGAVDGEVAALDGEQGVQLGAQPAVFRVDAAAGEHVGFLLTFPAPGAGIAMELRRWDATTASPLARTTAGSVRALAAFDPSGPRTFWIVLEAPAALAATLTVTRTPFADGTSCAADCARLLQLPVAIAPAVDGYRHEAGALFAYQFGRRDLVMMLRAAGQRMAAAGRAPFVVGDLSQWDGRTPGTDVGAPRHASHQRGRDADLAIYGTDGDARFRPFCDTVATAGGAECVAGTVQGLDARATLHLFAGPLATGRVVASFLDRELIAALVDAAPAAQADGLIAPELVPLLDDGTHLQHAANQYHHLHVRVSEAP